jgi:TRAP-type C4-dicarboxylate transport system permease small subunit
MKPTWTQSAKLGLGVLALLCWVVMFLAGTDIWHDLGRPDFGHLQGPPYADLRAVVYAFYLLFFVLVAHFIATIVSMRRT